MKGTRTIRAGIWLLLLLPVFLGASGQNPDIDLLRRINLDRPRALDQAFIRLDQLNEPLCVALPAGLFIAGWIRRDSATEYRALEAIAALGLSSAITLSLKYIIRRPRPFVTYPEIQHLVAVSSPSFPSGDATISFALATSLSLSYPRWWVIVPASLWAASVGYSRMDLGVHYPSDVLAGAITGAGSALISYEAGRWLNQDRRRHQRMEHF